MNPKTHEMTGGPVGDVIDMGTTYSTLSITPGSGGECWVRAQLGLTAAPSAPSATPAPANGAEADGWVHLTTENVGYTFPRDRYGKDGYRYIEIWEIGTGHVLCEGGN